MLGHVLVDADDDLVAPVDPGLASGRALLDAQLGHAGGDGLGHASQLLDLLDEGPRLGGQVVGQLLDVVAAGERVDDVGHAGLLGQDELGVAGDLGGEVGGQAQGLVEGVGVQALGAAQHGRQGLVRGAHDVVVGVLLGQGDARGLAVRAQHQRLLVLRVEAFHHPGPEQAGGPQLRHLHEQVHADGEEEREPGGEGVHVETPGVGRPDVFEAVGDGEGQFLVGGRPRLLHVVAGDGDRVEAGHVGRRVLDDVGHDPHARRRRVDVGVADHELLEDVVLDGPAELVLGHPLLLGRHHVAGQHGEHGPVHGHGDADPVQGDVGEEDVGVLHRVDGHPGHADVALHPGVVRVIAPVGGEVEGHRQAGLARGEVALVEGVGLLGGREAAVLAQGPGPVGVHRGPDAADEGREARQAAEVLDAGQIGLGVERRDGDALGRGPGQVVGAGAPQLLLGPGPPGVGIRCLHGSVKGT